uniref:Excinuclease ABC subunit UvrC n=1 Tax=candidate division CPR3 bacterium TaxID=2268181 RepID=A0A7V3N426_UNCC3
MSEDIRQQLSNLPNKPGVYIFRDKRGKILYIGKASSIRKRVHSYFRDRSILLPRIEKMVSQIAKIDFIESRSEIEALLLESNLIKKQKPKYNVEWKDDKNYLYIKVDKKGKGSRESMFPRVSTVRKPQESEAEYFGPFTDASAVRKTLSFLRRLFPYRTCRLFPARPCLWHHIKRCPAPCVEAISADDYNEITKQIILFLRGKQDVVLAALKKEMAKLSQQKKFEQAAQLRDRIKALEHINEIAVLRMDSIERGANGQWELINFLQSYYPNISDHPSFRIEAYDVSNISGTSGTGSMVVFVDGKREPNEYRRFAIKTVKKIDDVACMREILKRRFAHRDEWFLPDLILLDGGKGQLQAARLAQKEYRLSIPYIALAKKREEIYLPEAKRPIVLPKSSPALLFLQRIRDEAHRFAKSYHLKLRSKKLIA